MTFMRSSNRLFPIFVFLTLVSINSQSQNLSKEFPIILQENSLDCGPVCLQMIAEWYDEKCTIEELSEWAKLDSTGTSLWGLSVASDSLDFEPIAVKIPFHFFVDAALLPAIIHWNGNHFVVVYKADWNRVWVADPAYGKRIYSKEEFLKYWLRNQKSDKEAGIVLLLTKKEPPTTKN